MQGWSVVAHADPNADITGSFSDSCRDFQAHSSKDISHVEIHLADGRVVKDESIDSSDYAIDGGPGDEIRFANVKSGRTAQRFDCVASTPPTALLEVKRGPVRTENPGEWTSEDGATGWRSAECDRNNQPNDHSDPVQFRGINSSDPDGDIVSWSLEFGDGASTGTTSWADAPPVEVSHTYNIGSELVFGDPGYTATLSIADSAGNVSSDQLTVFVFYCGDID